MMRITEEMKEAIDRALLCFAATVNEDGTPNLSPKASLTVRGDYLYFANISSPTTVRNLRRNPAIEINVVDVFARKGFRFKGTAWVLSPAHAEYGPIAEWVWEKNGEQYPVHDVVKIQVEHARPLLSPAYVFSQGVTEDDLRDVFYKRYHVRPE